MKYILWVLLFWSWVSVTQAQDVEASPTSSEISGSSKVLVIPIQGEIANPVYYLLRRGLKDAIDQGVDTVVLDMDTPGGSAGVMLDMMEALDRFPGRTLTYVHDEAGSAGALIAAVTDEIYFSPTGVMGAAELITSTGQDVGDALKRKMTSFINAKIRAFSDSDPRRADVLKAMMSADYELKLDDQVLKPKGELLTLTAKEAMTKYGEPARPLLAKGIYDSINDLLDARLGKNRYSMDTLKLTWSEDVAFWLNMASPILLGLGLLGLFIEFKTPGFGVFGIVGGLCLAVVFFGNYAAGLSGHEPALVFIIGALLVLIELFFLPGVMLMALSGFVLMLGSLIWAMADLWPNQPVEFSQEIFFRPILNLMAGLGIAGLCSLLLARFLPRGIFLDHLILQTHMGNATVATGQEPDLAASIVGRLAVSSSDLRPSGQISIDGKRHEARVLVGMISKGKKVRITGRQGFELIVEEEVES